jgi:TetR/AcrR family transcriptional repressor of nem operon
MRTRDPDPATRRRLIDAAQSLMLSKGFVATSVDEICSHAGVTKGTFFHYFESKEELGKATIDRFASCQEDRFLEACSEIKDPLERVYRWIDCAIRASRDPSLQGCLVGTFAQEISDTHPALRRCCEQVFLRFVAAVGKDLALAKARHAPQAPFDEQSLGGLFLALVQGSLLVRKATGDRKQMEKNLLHLKSYLKELFGK